MAKMKTKKLLLLFLFISFPLYFPGCGDKPLFTELADNRIKVVIKGTYASNNPPPWAYDFELDDTETAPGLHDNSIDDCVGSNCPDTNEAPTVFRFDIAGLRASTGKHKQYFANQRMTFEFPLTNDEAFFNGNGIMYKNDDVRPDFRWQNVEMYIRKMIFDSATEYYEESVGNWVVNPNLTNGILTVLFHEETVSGFDFNQIQVNSYYDSLLNYYDDINRIFPLSIPVEDGFVFDNKQEETVLELRFVIQNFIKRYEYDYSDSYHYVRHYWALSDWLRNVYKDENKIGGNLLAVARSYVKGKTVTLTGNTGGATNCYVVAIKSPHTISEYGIIAEDRARPDCDQPKTPDQAVPNDIESLLDYYLKYQVYKEDYDTFVDCVDCTDPDNCYETLWNDYEAVVSGYRIPPLATWVGDSGDNKYTLTNVPVGETYTLYRSTDGTGSGELPGSFENLDGGSDPITVTISQDQAGETIEVE